MAVLTVILCALALLLLVVLLVRKAPVDLSPLQAELAHLREEAARQEERLRQEIAIQRREMQDSAQALRGELGQLVGQLGQSLREPVADLGVAQRQQLADFARQLEDLRETLAREAAHQRKEQAERQGEFANAQGQQLERLRGGVAEQLEALRNQNERKLEEMRHTVDEKLHDTLEKRLGESFRQVSEQLAQVYSGLGEMQSLATGVGDLKRVLSNVKSRGTWGEVQLGALLEQMLTKEQFVSQYRPRSRSAEVVEFAVRLPGGGDDGVPVFLPIDAKFPKEDYERLMEASERGDAAGVEAASRQLEARIKAEARDIRDKYIHPPATTDFALLFLPTEGLYGEVLRRPGLGDWLQRECRVVPVGPTTLTAILNGLQMGFQTLAIEKRSSEVWRLLATVKKKFESFAGVFEKAQKKILEAHDALGNARERARLVGDQLRKVEALPEGQATPELVAGEVELLSEGQIADAGAVSEVVNLPEEEA